MGFLVCVGRGGRRWILKKETRREQEMYIKFLSIAVELNFFFFVMFIEI